MVNLPRVSGNGCVLAQLGRKTGLKITWPVGAHCILMTHALAFTALRLTCYSGRVGTAVSHMRAIQE